MMTTETTEFQLIRTKLNPPHIALDLVPRSKLVNRLSRGCKRPLTLVSAPAGYGKTTLVSAWLETWEGPSAWLSLDERDSDLTAFLSYFLAAIQTMFPQACSKSLSFLKAESLPPVPYLASSVLNDLDEIDRPFVLVLDDFHTLRKRSVDELLIELLRYPPAGMHLVLITRHNPWLPLTRLRARGVMTEIRSRDLRFTTAEVAVLLQKMLQTDVDEAKAALIAQQTEGWVTGLRLAVLAARQKGNLEQLLSGKKDSNRYVFDYLMDEVFSHQPLEVQDFLVRSSILDRMCISLLEALAGVDEADQTRQIFQEATTQLNLFMISLDEQAQWFRYHHLFQQFLQQRLQQVHSPDEIAALHCRVADWYTQNGLIEEALSHALAADDTSMAVQLVARHRHALMNQDEWQRLRRWLDMFPQEVVDTQPELLLLDAWGKQVRWQLTDLPGVLDRLEVILAQSSLNEGTASYVQGEIDTLRAVRLVFMTDAESALPRLQRAQATLRDDQYYARGYATILLGSAYQLAGDLEAAIALASDGLQEIPSDGLFQTRLLIMLSLVYWIDADLENLFLAATRCFEKSKTHDAPLGVSWGRYFLGCIQYQRNDLTAAERSFSAVVNRPYLSHGLTFTYSACGLASTYQVQGRPNRARQVADSTVAFMLETQNTVMLQVAQAFQAELATRQGRIAEASQWALRRGAGSHHEAMPGFFGPELVLPKVLLAQNTCESREQAADYLTDLREFVASIHNKRFLIEVLALQALLYAAQGERPAALAVLEQAITLAQPSGIIRLFVDLGAKLEPLLTELARKEVAPDYIAQILSAFDGDNLKDDAVSLANTPQPIEYKLPPEPLDVLTNREMDVLLLLAKRLTNKEIAQELGISTETVKRHAKNLYRKLGVNNRRQAAASAHKLGILV